jgi:hypothetical protein
VYQSQRFGKILIEAQNGRNGARDLRDLDGVRQAVPEMVGQSGREHLGLGFQAAKSARVNAASAIALEGVAVGMIGFRIAASEAARNGKTQALEHEFRAIARTVRPLR